MVKAPTAAQLEEIARGYNLHLDEAEVRSFLGLMEGTLGSYQRLDQLVEPELPVRYPRSGGRRPEPGENPLGAWYRKCSIEGAPEGPLSGKRVAIKDNVCVAGISMMNGSSALEGYVPEFDATIVTRILDAGAEIVGKAVCEHLCFSGGSHTSDTGPVPYTGVFPIELTLDHTGPIAGSVSDVALLLEAIAGEDGLDPRQKGVRSGDYRGSLDDGVQGLRIGVVSEGFGWPNLSEEDVDETVRRSAQLFENLGAEVSEVSVPLHRDGLHIWNGIAIEGATELMVRGNSMGTNWQGHYVTSLLDAYAHGRTTRADDLSETVKLTLLLGQYMRDSYHGRYYAKAQNLGRKLSAAYDGALDSVDLLVMPTLPMKATPLPAADAPKEEVVARALEMIPNTAPFDVSGHPAMTVPCGLSDGLPIGMMLVGRRWEEETVLRAARAFEQTGTYTVRPGVVASG